jgi:hypothetical protein
MVGIERAHALPNGTRAEILLVDGSVVIDKEGHYAGVAVFSGIGNEREAADHVAAHNVVDGAAGRARPLRGKNLIIIAVKRRTASGLAIEPTRSIGYRFEPRDPAA